MLGGEKLSSTSLAHAQEMLASSAASRRPAERARDERPQRGRPLPLGGRGAKRGGSDPVAGEAGGEQPEPASPEIVLVTGISGSGKSVALHALEDAGFFCVDNLPPELLRDFLRLEQRAEDRRVAIAVDVRSAGSLPHLLPLLAQLRDEGVAVQAIFLDATTAALVRRFSETRRAHPLADRGALVEAIELERELLADLREVSTVVDTSQLRPTQLRSWMRELVRRRRQPPDAGVRELRLSPRRAARRRLRVRRPRPAEPALRARAEAADRPRRAGRRLPGGAARRGEMLERIAAFLRRWLPAFKADQRAYLTVAIGCTGGQHRSVWFVERLAERFAHAAATLIRHRELEPDAVSRPCRRPAALSAADGALSRRPARAEDLRDPLPRPDGALHARAAAVRRGRACKGGSEARRRRARWRCSTSARSPS